MSEVSVSLPLFLRKVHTPALHRRCRLRLIARSCWSGRSMAVSS